MSRKDQIEKQQKGINARRDIKNDYKTRHHHLFSAMNNIGEKGLRTVYINLVVVTVFSSLSVFADSEPIFNWVNVIGFVFLILSIIFGLLTYTGTIFQTWKASLKSKDIKHDSVSNETYLDASIHKYQEQISDMNSLIETGTKRLLAAIFFLGIGILILSFGLFLGLTGVSSPVVLSFVW